MSDAIDTIVNALYSSQYNDLKCPIKVQIEKIETPNDFASN